MANYEMNILYVEKHIIILFKNSVNCYIAILCTIGNLSRDILSLVLKGWYNTK